MVGAVVYARLAAGNVMAVINPVVIVHVVVYVAPSPPEIKSVGAVVK